jgi:hypothetical protein
LALEVIRERKYQSEKIDQIIPLIYKQSINYERVADRLDCIDIMLNNHPDLGLRWLKEFVQDSKNVSFNFRLIGAFELTKMGEIVDEELAKKGLKSDKKPNYEWSNKIISNMQKIKDGTLEVPPPAKTIPPPQGNISKIDSVNKKEIPSQSAAKLKTPATDSLKKIESTTNSVVSTSPSESSPTEKSSSKKLWIPLLAFFAVAGFGFIFFRKNRKK